MINFRTHAPRLALALALSLSTPLANADKTAAGKAAQSAPESNAPAQSAPKKSADSASARHRRAAYQKALSHLITLTPDEIRKSHNAIRAEQKALHEQTTPAAASRTVHVDIGPGATPATVHVAPNYGAALTVLDATGQPWPVSSVTPGNAKAFQVNKPIKKGKGASILTVVPLIAYAQSNLIITLAGLSTPIIIRLVATDDTNNGRTDLVIGAEGPLALAHVSQEQLGATDNPVMRTLLDGVPPPKAVSVAIKGGPARAWIVGHKLYLRTSLRVISPAWIRAAHGANGVAVYQMPMVPTISATDSDGETDSLRIADSALLDGVLAQNGATVADKTYGPSASFKNTSSR